MPTAARIYIGNGQYCYSGSNCQWHSANGVSKIKQEIKRANADLLASDNFEDTKVAFESLKKNQALYDSTPEGHKSLYADWRAEKDLILKGKLASRLNAGQRLATEIEKEQETAWKTANAKDPEAQAKAKVERKEEKFKKAKETVDQFWDTNKKLKIASTGEPSVYLTVLAKDSDSKVRLALTKNPNFNIRHINILANDKDEEVVLAAMKSDKVSLAVLEELTTHRTPAIRNRAISRKYQVIRMREQEAEEKKARKRAYANRVNYDPFANL